MPIRENVHINYKQKIRPYHQVISRAITKYYPGEGRLLDIGCGTGNLLEEIIKHNSELELNGADIDETCLNITEKAVPISGKFHITDVDDLFNMNIEQFDIVVMSHVLEHVKRPYDTVRSILSKLVKKRGILVLAVPNPVIPDVIIKNVIRRYNVNEGHIQTWDQSHFRNFLEKILGLEVLEYPPDFIRIPYLDQKPIFFPILKLLARAFPGFSRSCIAVIRN